MLLVALCTVFVVGVFGIPSTASGIFGGLVGVLGLAMLKQAFGRL
jgi:hypothetical protein